MKNPKAETRIYCYEIADYRTNPSPELSRVMNCHELLLLYENSGLASRIISDCP